MPTLISIISILLITHKVTLVSRVCLLILYPIETIFCLPDRNAVACFASQCSRQAIADFIGWLEVARLRTFIVSYFQQLQLLVSVWETQPKYSTRALSDVLLKVPVSA